MVVLATLLALLLAAVGAPDETAPPVEVPASVDASGTRDVTAELNRFFRGVPDASVVRLAAGARYRVEGTVVLDGHRGLTVEGNGAVLFATSQGDRSRSHLVLRRMAGVVLRELVVRGAHPEGGVEERAWRTEQAFQHGVRIEGSTDVELDGVRVTDVFGDFVYVGPDDDGGWSSRVWIHDSAFARNGRQGIAVTAGRDVVIERNEISQTRRATIDLEPGSPAQGAENVHILDNRVGPGRLRFVAAHGGGPVNDVVIAGNEIRGRGLSVDVRAPEGQRRRGFWVLDNRADIVASNTGLQFTRVDDLVVRGNRQIQEGDDAPGVLAREVCSLAVGINDFGPGTTPVVREGGRCGGPPPSDPPLPPELAGRSVATGADEEADRDADAPFAPPSTDEAVDDGVGAGGDAAVVALAALVAMVALAVGAGALAWRRRRRSPGDEPTERVPGGSSGALVPRPMFGPPRPGEGQVVDVPLAGDEPRPVVEAGSEVRGSGTVTGRRVLELPPAETPADEGDGD